MCDDINRTTLDGVLTGAIFYFFCGIHRLFLGGIHPTNSIVIFLRPRMTQERVVVFTVKVHIPY